MDNKAKKARKHGHDKQQTHIIVRTRALTAKFLGARNKKHEGSEWLLRALVLFLMVLCASFFSGIMAVLNQVRRDDGIRARDKRMADGGIRKKATQRGNDSYRRVAL